MKGSEIMEERRLRARGRSVLRLEGKYTRAADYCMENRGKFNPNVPKLYDMLQSNSKLPYSEIYQELGVEAFRPVHKVTLYMKAKPHDEHLTPFSVAEQISSLSTQEKYDYFKSLQREIDEQVFSRPDVVDLLRNLIYTGYKDYADLLKDPENIEEGASLCKKIAFLSPCEFVDARTSGLWTGSLVVEKRMFEFNAFRYPNHSLEKRTAMLLESLHKEFVRELLVL